MVDVVVKYVVVMQEINVVVVENCFVQIKNEFVCYYVVILFVCVVQVLMQVVVYVLGFIVNGELLFKFVELLVKLIDVSYIDVNVMCVCLQVMMIIEECVDYLCDFNQGCLLFDVFLKIIGNMCVINLVVLFYIEECNIGIQLLVCNFKVL